MQRIKPGLRLCLALFLFAVLIGAGTYQLRQATSNEGTTFEPIVEGPFIERLFNPPNTYLGTDKDEIHFSAKVSKFRGPRPVWWGQSYTGIKFRKISITTEDGMVHTPKDYSGSGGGFRDSEGLSYFIGNEGYYYELKDMYLPKVREFLGKGNFQATLVLIDRRTKEVLYSTQVSTRF